MKKILSLMMAMLLVFSSFSVLAAYENDVESADNTISNSSYPAYLVNSTSSTLKNSKDSAVSIKNAYMVYRIPLGDKAKLEGNQIYSSFKFHVFFNRSSTPNGSVSLYKMPGESYDVTKLTSSNISNTSTGRVLSCENSSGNIWKMTFDITDYANECAKQNVMYIAVTGESNTVSSYGGAGNYRPLFSFTPTAVPALSLESVSLSDGAEITTDTIVSFTYSAPVESAEITLNGESAQSTISSNVVTLTSSLSQLKSYDLSIVATDSYSSSDSYSMSFTTGIDKDTFSGNTTVTKLISENAPTNLINAGNNVDHTTGDYAYFKMPLPEIGSEGLIDKYTVRFYTMMESTVVSPIQVFALSGDEWDEATLTVNSDGYAEIVADYDTYGIKDAVKYVEAGPSGDHLLEADLTEYASKCLAEGQTSISIAINSTATFKIFGNANYTSNSYRKPTVYAEILTNPEIAVYDVSCKVPGNTLRDFSFKLLKKAPSCESYVKLINTINNEEQSASFDYSPYTRTVYLTSPVTLAEQTTYRIILESEFDSSLSEDIVVCEFTTGIDFDIENPKLILANDTVSDYALAQSLEALTKGNSYKYVTEVTNNTASEFELIMAIAVYNSDDELIDFVFEPTDIPNTGTDIYYSDEITIPADASKIKAFAWDKNYDPLTAFDYALATAAE